ncbi:MAG: hypothetical protein IAF02_05315 [Anaerolineae bacterium]|nr:hypothetical protein [Anaerolineae bacterium]
MEAYGINMGYLLIQLFCLVVIPLLILGSVVYWLIKRNPFKQGELITTLVVTDEGVVIPKELLPDTENINIYKHKDKLILSSSPVVE